MAPDIRPCDATLGAVVSEIALGELTEPQWQAVEAAFHEFAVLIFPDQHLTDAQQIEFGARFGRIEQLVADRNIVPISNRREDGSLLADEAHGMQVMMGNEGWHTDSSYMPLAAKASVLSAHVVPESGGETEWADMRAAFDALDAGTQQQLQDLAAYHSLYYSQGQIGHVVKPGAGYGFHTQDTPRRPLVKRHPVTNCPSLYVGRHAYGVGSKDGSEMLDEIASAQLLDDLVSFACQPPRLIQHTWTPGDIVVWDNRCVLHRARPYDHREARVMKHTRIAGEPDSETCLPKTA